MLLPFVALGSRVLIIYHLDLKLKSIRPGLQSQELTRLFDGGRKLRTVGGGGWRKGSQLPTFNGSN